MDIYKEILANALMKQDLRIEFPNLKINTKEIVEMECYRVLEEIRGILMEEDYSDEDCVLMIDEIISVFFSAGIDSGWRHD